MAGPVKREGRDGATSSSDAPVSSSAPASPSAEELRRIADEIGKSFPARRSGTELVLMEIDPRRAHAYWRIETPDYDAAVRGSAQDHPTMVLRMYDISGIQFDGANARSSFDVAVQGLQGHWYVDLFADGRTYTADLGLLRADRSIVRLARSNAIRTPSSKESPYYEVVPVHTGQGNGKDDEAIQKVVDQATRHRDEALTWLEHAAPPETAASAEFPMIASDDKSEPEEAPTADAQDETKPIVEIPIGWPTAAAAAAGAPPVAEAFQESLQKLEDEVEAESESEEMRQAPTPAVESADKPASAIQVGWPTAQAASEGMPAAPGGAPAEEGREGPATPSIEAADRQARGEAAASTPGPGPASQPLPLENYLTYSSGESGRRDVWLEINTELHIYGRAQPNSELTLYGQKVQTRPDGTFSIRKPLPQGAIVLPLLFTGRDAAGSSSSP